MGGVTEDGEQETWMQLGQAGRALKSENQIKREPIVCRLPTFVTHGVCMRARPGPSACPHSSHH